MRPLLPILLLAPALAQQGGEDLPTMARKYGLSTVAAVVRSASGGDVTPSQVHASLRSLGLDRVAMPAQVAPGARGLSGVGPISGCGWNDGVYCAVTLPAGAPAEVVARCVGKRTPLDLSIPVVVDPPPTAEAAGTAHLGDMLPCWEAGGARVPPAPELAPARFEGWTEAAARAALAPVAEALAACGRPNHRLVIERPTEAPAELTLREGGREDLQATACARRAVGAALDAAPVGATVDAPSGMLGAPTRPR
jgi:hypothetical protein